MVLIEAFIAAIRIDVWRNMAMIVGETTAKPQQNHSKTTTNPDKRQQMPRPNEEV